MDRRLGGPLPHQLANPTRVHLIPPEFFTLSHEALCAYAVLAAISETGACHRRKFPDATRLPERSASGSRWLLSFLILLADSFADIGHFYCGHQASL